jgi:N-methylhydantoinase A
MGNLRLGIDVGGTFTDLALADVDSGAIWTEKILTTPHDPSEAIFAGIETLAKNALDVARVVEVIHGTTLITNAIVERQGAKAGLLATRGFRDIPQFVGRELRYDIYDPDIVFPDPLIPRRLCREVDERIHGDGTVGRPLNSSAVREVISGLLEEQIESLAVCLLHSYLNSRHEEEVFKLIRETTDIPVSLSHEVLPRIREYERFSATIINAYVQPVTHRYLGQLKAGLERRGIAGVLYLMTSSGGTMTSDTAERFPIQLVESGPAAGTLIAALTGRMVDANQILSFDMGGTTAKACAIRGGRPLITDSYEVSRVRRFKKGSGLPAGIPVVDLIEIGAGGGSIASIDPLGLLRVGPRSAGADPGPACYGRGGTEPTVTDANVVLGFIDPAYFLGGKMELDVDAARNAIETHVGAPLGLSCLEAAAAINRVVTEQMAEAARVHAVEVNVDIRRFKMVAFGGAGPIHAYGVADRLKVGAIICPPNAGVLSAVGLLVAPLAFEFARSLVGDLDDLDVRAVTDVLRGLERRGKELLEAADIHGGSFERSVDMCYSGQGFEVKTPLALPFNKAALKRAFDDTYEQTYGRRLSELRARCVTWRVLATGPVPDMPLRLGDGRSAVAEHEVTPVAPRDSRTVFFPEYGQVTCDVYERSALPSGACFVGPALVQEIASTIVVAPGMRARVNSVGHLVLRQDDS